MHSHLDEHNLAGATVSVVGGDELLFARGYGYADVENEEPVIADETLFRVGSVSKLVAYTGVMQGVERDELDLDADVSEYLKGVTIPETEDGPITLEHLGTHTPGFEDRLRGLFLEDEADLRPLGETLADEQPTRIRPPGEFASYSNYGSALAGHIVAIQAGMEFEEYVQQNVFEPLGMERSTFSQPVPEESSGRLSKGHQYRNGALRDGGFEYIGLPPAGSMSATATDMARFMLAHLNAGEFEGQQLLESATIDEMHRRRFTHDERVNGICYGFYEMGYDNERIIGHGGDTQLFHSQLLLVPERNLGLFVSYNSPGGFIAREEFIESFLDRFVGEPEAPEGTGSEPTRADELTGSYRGIRYPHTTYEKVGAFGTSLEVEIEDDVLTTEILGLGTDQWIEIEPLVFRREDGGDTLVFHEGDGEITHLFMGSIPVMAFERLAWYEATTTQLAVINLSLVIFLSAAVGWSAAGFWRRLGNRPLRDERLRVARWTGGLASGLFVLFLIGLIVLVAMNPSSLLAGAPLALIGLLVLPILAGLAALGTLGFAVLAWRKKYWGLIGRLHYTLVALTSLVFLAILSYWNLLGFHL